jgi:hypothetical protein
VAAAFSFALILRRDFVVTRCTKRSSAAPNSRPIRRSSAGKTVPVNAVRFARTSAKVMFIE